MFSRPNLFNRLAIISIILLSSLVTYFQHANKIPTNTNIQKNRAIQSLPLADSKLDKIYGQLPLGFETNIGQADQNVKFISHGFDYNLLLTQNKAIFVSNHKQNTNLSLEFIGANDNSKIVGSNQLEIKTNYLLGQDKTKWQKEITNYSQVTYQEIYSGIDLIFYGNKKNLEYDLVVAPNIDPNLIQLKFQGLEKAIKIDKQGDLLLPTQSGIIRQHKPFIYQEIEGNKVPISGSYNITESNLVSFNIGDYDQSKALIIDPEISYSTYLGGSLTDEANAIAVDTQGNAYIVGSTSSTDFPVANALQRNFGGGPFDVFVAKINPNGNGLVYATYFGGSSIDQGFDIAVDASGSAYITGLTISTNFPTKGGLQTQKGGGTFDGFVTKLNPAGNDLVYSTYLGGNDDDQGFSLAINSAGNAFITGSTSSRNFPGAQNTSLSGPSDSFVTQLNVQGTQIVYSRYLGGSDEEEGSSIVVDSTNNAYITGDTFSNNFPLQMAIQSSLSGGQDAFLTKLNPNGTILYSTYFGGSNNDAGIDVAVDTDNNAYLAGTSNSTNLLAKSALQRNLAGGQDAFLTKIDPTGANLIFSTYLGGQGDDILSSIGLDPLGNVYLAGATFSTDFPITKPVQDKNKGMNDVFVSVLNSDGSSFIYSTYLGGKAQDVSLGMAVNKDGTVYLTGLSISGDFPVSSAFQKSSGGNSDAFITKITNELTPPTPDFSITITPSSQTISAGNTTSFTINSKAISGFNQPISLTATANPVNSGLTTSFSNNTIMPGANTTLTVNTAANLSPSSFTITITATANQIVRTLTATVNIVTSDFSITVEPSSQTVMVGGKASFTIKLKAINGFNQAVMLAASTSPSDSSLTSSFSSDTISPDTSATLTINSGANTLPNTFTVTIVGLANQLVRTATATLVIANTPPTPDFSLTVNPSQLMVARKQSGTFNVVISRLGNFSGSVTVTPPDTKAMKIILTPSTQSTSGTIANFSFKIKKKATRGTQMLTFVGRDDSGRSRMATLALTIQ